MFYCFCVLWRPGSGILRKRIIPRPPCDMSCIVEEVPLTPSLEGKDQSQDLSGYGKDLLCPFTGVGLVPGLTGD